MGASRVNHLTGAAVAAGLAAAALLSGCGEHHVGPAQEASAPVSRPDSLAGAPSDAPAPPVGPPEAPPPIPPPERSGDREVVYDLGPVVGPHDTMAPIPNPPETRRAPHGPRPPRPAVTPRRPHHPHHAAGPSVRPSTPARPTPSRPAAPPPKPPRKPAAPAPAPKPDAPSGADRTTKLSALQSSLRDGVARMAVLSSPSEKPDVAQDVTLRLPADFASLVRDQAAKQGLQDAASTVKMTALLAGDGYRVAPDETQPQPLTVGQPTEFHWTVTPQQGARGPLHADVGADLLGGGDAALQLGSVTPRSGLHVSPRAWGAALLVLLAVLLFAWLSRGRSAAAGRRTREERRRGARASERPLDIGTPPPPARFNDEL